MNYPFATILAGASALLFSSCATTKSGDQNAPTGPPSATLHFEGGQAGYWATAGGGKGSLHYKRSNYPFTAKAAGAGGSGAQKVSATGQVYNLNSLADFEGTYTKVSTGFTIIRGTAHAKLTNSDGVVIYVEAKTTGLSSSTGVTELFIDLQ